MLFSDDVFVSSGSDYDISLAYHTFQFLHLITIHTGLKGTYRVDFSDRYNRSGPAERGSRSFSNITVSGYYHPFTGKHSIGGTPYGIHSTFLAPVFVVELRFRYRIIYIDGRHGENPIFESLVKPVYPGSGFFRQTSDPSGELRIVVQHHVGEVSTIVQNHIQRLAFLPEEEAAHFTASDDLWKLANPISEDMKVMRPSLIPGLLTAAKRAATRGASSSRLFEIGRRYFRSADGLSDERQTLGVLLAG